VTTIGLGAARDIGQLIDGHVESELAVRLGVGLDGRLQWDRIRPLIYRALCEPESLRSLRLRLRGAAEIGKNVVLSHGRLKYSMLNSEVKDAGPACHYAQPCMETMGERIRQLRKARGLTQEAFARRVGVTKSAVSQWEDGSTKNLKLATFLLVCEILVTDAEYLIWGDDRAPSGGAAKKVWKTR
jgi:DNA-binding transcriptional regulator YiaG